jgi:uncharacterized protein (TIGR02145 family)
MNQTIKIGVLAGLLLAIGAGRAFAQMPGMPYMPAPATITLAQNQKYTIASIYDKNYLPYTAPTTAATTATLDVGSISPVTIDVQGNIPTTGITVNIPARATGNGTLQAYTSSPITIPAAMTEDGVSRDLILSWTAQPYNVNTRVIAATISAVSGTLNAKKLDINAGVGNDGLGVLMGSFSYPYNNAGATTTYQVRDIAGIPDKMFGKNDNAGVEEHDFIYVPVVGEDGKIWLNNNLGADYSNVSSSSFSPGTQATAYNDYHAYGSIFQWGRQADGHELINWNSNPISSKYPPVQDQSATDTPTSAQFLYGSYDWRSTPNDNLWQGEAGTNNPCPNGFRVPTTDELTALFTMAGITYSSTAAASKLRFTVAGHCYSITGGLAGAGETANYWSSSVAGSGSISAYNLGFWGGGMATSANNRGDGFPVRCLMNNPQVTGLSGSTATLNLSTVYAGVNYSGTATVPYTGGNGLTYPAGAAIASTGVTGLTATLQTGTLASGAGNLTYTLSGTPSGSGTATFAISFGGQTCLLNVTILATITLAQNQKYLLASIHDADYLPYTAPTEAATTTTPVAAGGTSPATIDVQGRIPTTGITMYIPTSATGNGTLQAYTSSPITIPASMTEDGISRDLTLSWAVQAYNVNTRVIAATINSVGGTLNAKKLDINAGVGNDCLGVLMGSFSYPYNNAGDVTTFQVRDIAGIPDRMFGQYDLGSTTTYEHNFIYVPVVGEDGKIWLNNNLGADYSDLNSTSFSPATQAKSYDDYHAYGSMFQWGRKPDGHELITWTSGYAITPKYGNTSDQNDSPTNALFVTNYYDWRKTQDNMLWATEASANNPCPSGFRVPTSAEQSALTTAAGITGSTTAISSKLRLSATGRRKNGSSPLSGATGMYWSSSTIDRYSEQQIIPPSDIRISNDSRSSGFSVRCLMNNPQVTALSCGTATVSPATVYAGVNYSGTATVPYTGGNGLTYPAGAAIASTGVTGLTATLQAGTLASGAGNLTYTLSGTPSGTGTATFALSFGGQSCSFSVTVSAIIPANITLAQTKKYLLASIYDNNYLPYTAPTATATTAKLDVGSTSPVTVDVQGCISTTGITVYIPATATGSGTLQAYTSSPITIPAEMTEDGISRSLTLSWAAQAYTSSTKAITATLSAVGGTLNAKKLDINAGVGNDGLGVLLGSFSYPYNNAGATTTYQVRDIAGIPDRMFGKYDLGSTTTYEHNFIYVPVVGEDGQIWLNNNLGADYSNVSSTSFSPGMQATSATDYLAYGSLFQWGRPADGHELTSWTNSTSGTPIYSAVSGQSETDTPTSANFLIGHVDWRSTQNDNLWQGEAGTNNPCPSGFRVPANDELTALITAAGITNYATAAASKLRFSVPGKRDEYDGKCYSTGTYEDYWSSSVNGTYIYTRYLGNTFTSKANCNRASGYTVRCIGN